MFLYFCTITHIDTTCRRAQKILFILVFLDRSDDAFGTISAGQKSHFHHHCSSQNRARTFFFYISRIFVARYKNETKKETFELRGTRYVFCLPRSFRRRLRNDISTSSLWLSSSSSLDAEKPKNRESARAPSSSFFYISRLFAIRKQKDR